MKLDTFLQSKVRWHLGYNLTSIPAGDQARLEEALNNVQDSFWVSKIVEQLGRCDEAEKRTDMTGSINNDTIPRNRIESIAGDVDRTVATSDFRETFPLDRRLNINTASARQIADTLPGVGLKTARDIKDLQTTMTGERYTKLEQLRGIKRIDWDAIFNENLVRVD